MSKSYDRNIERLKANQASISKQEQEITTAAAKARGDYEIEHARDIGEKLTPFSKSLQEWKKKDIDKQIEEGRQEREKTKLENAKWMLENGSEAQAKLIEIEKAREAGELAQGFETAAAQDDVYQTISRQLLRRDGVQAFPDADRIAKLSPWQQVGYVQESIKNKKAAAQDMIAQAMQNSTEEMMLGDIRFTPKEIADNNLAFPMKEHALNIITDKVYRNLGLDKYSDAMLERAEVPKHFRDTKESILSKYRSRYTIEASMNTVAKATLALEQSEYSASDINKFLLTVGNTTNTKGVLLDNSGAWALLQKHLIKKGMNHPKSVEYGTYILDKPMPDSMCRELGVKYGTTFAKQWPNRVTSINQGIKKALTDARKAEDQYLDSKKVDLENQFRQEASTEWLDGKRVEEYKDRFTAIGEKPPEWLVKYETASLRSVRKDKIEIKNLIEGNDGFITHAMLDEFHPSAALEYRKEATRHEEALKKTHNVTGTIKAALNQSWTDAGLKGKEKSVVWEQAFARAQKDFERQFNTLVAAGYDHDTAVKLAMDAPLGSVIDPTTKEPIPDFEGVVSNLERTGAKSKYTQRSEQEIEDLDAATIRVSKIREGKEEMAYNSKAYATTVIGGKYGTDRLNEIIQAHKEEGGRPEDIWKAIRSSQEAYMYYDGLARSKRGLSTMALIDAQLKASGLHPGLWPNRVEEKDESGIIDSKEEALQPTKYEGSIGDVSQVFNNLGETDRMFAGQGSIWNTDSELSSWMTA